MFDLEDTLKQREDALEVEYLVSTHLVNRDEMRMEISMDAISKIASVALYTNSVELALVDDLKVQILDLNFDSSEQKEVMFDVVKILHRISESGSLVNAVEQACLAVLWAANSDLEHLRSEVVKMKRVLRDQSDRLSRRRDDDPKSQSVRDQVAALTQGRCAYCDDDLGDGWHVEHVVPVSQGGPDTFANFVPSCKQCNSEKMASHVVNFIEKRKRRESNVVEITRTGT